MEKSNTPQKSWALMSEIWIALRMLCMNGHSNGGWMWPSERQEGMQNEETVPGWEIISENSLHTVTALLTHSFSAHIKEWKHVHGNVFLRT